MSSKKNLEHLLKTQRLHELTILEGLLDENEVLSNVVDSSICEIAQIVDLHTQFCHTCKFSLNLQNWPTKG